MRMFTFFQRSPLPDGGGVVTTTPIKQSERIAIIDSLRGIALLGILLMNMPGFALPFEMYFNLNVRNEYSGPNYYTWWIVNAGFEGTMRAIFTMLFGAGCLLLLGRLEKRNNLLSAADIYYRRLIWLLIFGLINAFILLWPGDILYTYAICGLFLFPFRNCKPSWLLAFGIFMMLVANLKNTLSDHDIRSTRQKGEQVMALLKKDSTLKLTEQQEADKKKWEAFLERNKIESIRKRADKAVKDKQHGYFSIMGKLKDVNMRIQSKTFYNEYFWDAMCLLFIGMALFKWKVLTGERSKRFYWIMTVAGYAIGLPLSLYFLHVLKSTGFDRSLRADKIIVDFYQEKRFFLSLGHIGVVMLLYKYGLLKRLLHMLARTGQMAFTNYLAQSLISILIFYGFGFGWYGKLERYEVYYVVAAIWVFQVVFSTIWLRYFQFGPLEWVWRSLTYWRKQPWRTENR